MGRRIELNQTEKTVRIIEHTGKWTDEDRSITGEATYHLEELPENIVNHCALHGLSQKLADSTASMSENKGFTREERYDVIEDLYKQLHDGNWTKPSTGGANKITLSKVEKAAMEAGMTMEQVALLKKALGH